MIAVETTIQAPLDKIWIFYVLPEHIVNWNYATDEWHCPSASCDLTPGGKFSFRMASKNGEHEFDLKGTYTDIKSKEFISYELEDKRKVQVKFEPIKNGVSVEQRFEPESTNSHEMQRDGWQAILNNFKKYVESNL
jgi:uncharacterized protein YndB with AHSA1/START domain